MNRRNFFKSAALTAGALALGSTGSIFSSVKYSESLNLEIITDNSGKALKLAEDFLKNSVSGKSVIKYSEYPIEYSANGDIILFTGNKLVNYKQGLTYDNAELREIANELKLPRILSNPVKLSFKISEGNNSASDFLVFKKGKLTHKINTAEKDYTLNIEGAKTPMQISFKSGKAKVISSGCIHQNCVNSGSVSKPGESIVCIPNEIYIIAE